MKAVVQANRNGFYYALDRTNGNYWQLRHIPRSTGPTASGPDGRPILIANREPTEEGTLVCPGLGGGHNWEPTAYSPQDRFYYFGCHRRLQVFHQRKQEYVEGRQYQAGGSQVRRRS